MTTLPIRATIFMAWFVHKPVETSFETLNDVVRKRIKLKQGKILGSVSVALRRNHDAFSFRRPFLSSGLNLRFFHKCTKKGQK